MAEGLRISGVVKRWHAMGMTSFPLIGETDVIHAIDERWPESGRPALRVWLGVEPRPPGADLVVDGAAGETDTCYGFTGTDVTPADPPVLKVGDLDLLDTLDELDGREVVLVVEGA